MRQLKLHMIMSVDGFVGDDKGGVNPETQWEDEELQRFYLDLFSASGGIVYGRTIYEQYLGHWSKVAAGQIPASTDLELRWTQRLIAMDKYVISHSPGAAHANTEVLSGDIAAAVTGLKQRDGGDLLLICGPGLFAELTRHQLIDEYMLYVCPNAMGHGLHLFQDIDKPLKLRPGNTVPFGAGMNLQYYRPMVD
jgi:dihydrofolate reductase